MNDTNRAALPLAILTGARDATIVACGSPQIHPGASTVRHRDRVRHLVDLPGVLAGSAVAAHASDAERGAALARDQSCLLVHSGAARARDHGVCAAASVRPRALAASGRDAYRRRTVIFSHSHRADARRARRDAAQRAARTRLSWLVD